MLIRRLLRQAGGSWGRATALAGAVALAATALITVAAGPALAGGSDQIFLTNAADHLGMYAANGVVQNSLIAVNPNYGGEWEVTAIPGYSNEFEFQAITQKGVITNWCIATTENLQVPWLQACGANGTVFIAVQSQDGYLLYSRFLVNEGHNDVLAVEYPGPTVELTTVPVSDVGGNWYGRWSDVSGYL